MIGRITFWNQPKGYGFITFVEQSQSEVRHVQYFLHNSNFTKGENPVLGAFVVFHLGEPFALGKKVQAVGARFATAEEIAQYKQDRKSALTTSQKAGGAE